MNNWMLVKRFFMADTIGGINVNGGWKDKSPPVVIRYASSIKLKIQLDNTQNEKIYPPYLEITYFDRKSEDI